ncbi:MarR family transcriptional regulator [Ichthyenterobacterium sp. W332]|uniref:MarR family transcriptional regulator n=1 Tax=Microcosmobacter mediterraneus TaxID=3075607 RepID=A0ABU2YN68_9FLAO|nr:MarR family transcriptional regulator [Ichthyenterobacterium sp. W332]MDT0559612.1 MarR family transcriptional regulator [Ichthyenterobacterium sp. W332]
MQELKSLLQTKSDMPLQKQAVINLFLSSSHVKDILISALKPHDLSLEQFNVLRILRGHNKVSVNLQDIQCRMVNKMSNTTRLVDKLIKKNFVTRSICSSNRRKVEITITNNGLYILKNLDEIIEQAENNATNNLSNDELVQLNRILSKIRT